MFHRAKAPPAKKNIGLWGREWRNLDQLSTLSGLIALVDFPLVELNSILDNCLTNKPELYDQPFLFQALIKDGHWSIVLPPGKKSNPFAQSTVSGHRY